jgi:hypothetical protein
MELVDKYTDMTWCVVLRTKDQEDLPHQWWRAEEWPNESMACKSWNKIADHHTLHLGPYWHGGTTSPNCF